MLLLDLIKRARIHAGLRMPGSDIISCRRGAVNGGMAAFLGSVESAFTSKSPRALDYNACSVKRALAKTNPEEGRFRACLLAWYDTHARDLPWRKSRDPYRIWISEIMLQQTRVAAVIEHYHAFLRRFPNVEKLAAAREASVLAAWSGLGYYRRARMLHAAAKVIVRKLRGKFPETADGWLDLPGIGRYTAAAIASIAFGEAVAVVDGNVERVLQRLSGAHLSPAQMWQAAESLLDRACPGNFNQAMMELGATVCTPRAPACLMCPVVEICATRGELAGFKPASRQTKREIHYALHCRDSRVLLVERPRYSSLMPGMWELPETEGPDGHEKPAFTVKHSITTTDYTVCVWNSDSVNGSQGEWVPRSRLPRIPLTGLARKILRRAGVFARTADL